MQIDRLNGMENNFHQVNHQQADLERSQNSAQREMTSIHIKMKNSAQDLKGIQGSSMNYQQKQKPEEYDSNQQINTQKNSQSNQKIGGSQNRIVDPNKQQVYKQTGGFQDENNKDKNDHSVFNPINFPEYHKSQKQDMELINNVSNDDEEPLVSPENRLISSKCTVDNTLFCLFFTLVTIAGIILYIYQDMYWLIIVGATLYFLECFCTNFQVIFERTINENDFYNLYKNALGDDPQIQYKASAYTIVVKPKNKKSQNTTQQPSSQQKQNPQQNNAQNQQKNNNQKKEEYIRVRELVYSEQRSFDYSEHKDFSHPLQTQKDFFKVHGLIRIKPVVFWKCGNEETLISYRKMQNEILDLLKQRSTDIEKSEISYIIPFEDCNYVVKSNGKSSPIFFNKASYFLFSFLFLSFPFRLYYLNTIKTLELYICKKVFI